MGGAVVTVAGISMVKDEMDILPWTLPRMAAQLDFVIVADNLSTDGTPDYLHDVQTEFEICVVEDPEPGYTQSAKMSNLAEMARQLGATWAVPFDADEVWASPSGRLADVLKPYDANGWHVVEATLHDHVVTGSDDPGECDPIKRIGWRRVEPLRLPKVALRLMPGAVIEMGNHGAHYPGPHTQTRADIEICHYPYRSAPQMARKARNGADAYAAAQGRVPATAGQHWRDYGRLLDAYGEKAMVEVFDTWFYVADPVLDDSVIYEP